MKMISASICFLALALTGQVAWAETAFVVSVDHARILRLPREASAVVVGNPAIADAAVHDGKMLFITGKTYGITNFIAIDHDGRTIMSRELRVLPPSPSDRVTLHRGEAQSTYACGNAKCEPVPSYGDAPEVFTTLMNQQNQKTGQADSAAGN